MSLSCYLISPSAFGPYKHDPGDVGLAYPFINEGTLIVGPQNVLSLYLHILTEIDITSPILERERERM